MHLTFSLCSASFGIIKSVSASLASFFNIIFIHTAYSVKMLLAPSRLHRFSVLYRNLQSIAPSAKEPFFIHTLSTTLPLHRAPAVWTESPGSSFVQWRSAAGEVSTTPTDAHPLPLIQKTHKLGSRCRRTCTLIKDTSSPWSPSPWLVSTRRVFTRRWIEAAFHLLCI